jgi:hypothetical protein
MSFGAAPDRAIALLKPRRKFLTSGKHRSGGELGTLERLGLDRCAHPSSDWLLWAAINPLKEAQRCFVRAKLDNQQRIANRAP